MVSPCWACCCILLARGVDFQILTDSNSNVKPFEIKNQCPVCAFFLVCRTWIFRAIMSHQIAQLRVLFEYIDVDGDGIISFFEFIQLLGMTDATWCRQNSIPRRVHSCCLCHSKFLLWFRLIHQLRLGFAIAPWPKESRLSCVGKHKQAPAS